MTSRSLTLANGLLCHLQHQPDTRLAAALIRVEAGSLDEQDHGPGIAHLLEHLLFCGSARFSAEESLMSWVQQQGGQLNATTQPSRSAFFFQIPAPELSAGLHRLCDMLAAPLLTHQAIQQQTTVIDAEYRLLQTHPETLCKAALFNTLPVRFARFRVGSRAAFGDNAEKLQSALRHFHHRLYHADNMQLWLHGPQSLDELAQLAERYGAMLPSGTGGSVAAEISFAPRHDCQIQLDGDESFWLTLMLDGPETMLRDNVSLLTAFWLDEAPGSLMAHLRKEELCESLNVQWLWQNTRHSWLALRFCGPDITPGMSRRIEHYFWQHLARVGACSKRVLQHYTRLAQQDFVRLPPLEQLRGRALNFAPSTSLPADFNEFVTLLSRVARSRLLTQRSLAGQLRHTQGFMLRVLPWLPETFAFSTVAEFSFYPQSHTAIENPTPAAMQSETLLLRPAFYQLIDEDEALARQRLLRPVLAALRHAGGSGWWRQKEGIWQLELNLPDSQAQARSCIRQAVQALNAEAVIKPVYSSPDIVIRQLLKALPRQILTGDTQSGWFATWYGETSQLRKDAAVVLKDYPPHPAYPAQPPQLQSGITPITCTGSDSALLLFIPLEQRNDSSLAALRVLALMAEPRFFDRLRVKQQIGYVVSARYQRVADVDGLLLALQSPDTHWRSLLGHCKRFLRDMHKESCQLSATELATWQSTLLAQCDIRGNADAATQRLRQQQGLPCLTREAINSLKLEQIAQLQQRLLRERHRWRILIAIPEDR